MSPVPPRPDDQEAGWGSDRPEGQHTIFVAGGDDQIAGEAIISLTEVASHELRASVPSGPMNSSLGAPKGVGLPGLDRVLAGIDTCSITHLDSPAPPTPVGAMALAEQAWPTPDYRVRFDPHIAVDEAVTRLARCPEVADAEPNRWRETLGAATNDHCHPEQWGLRRIGCPAAWGRGVGEPHIMVAVIDTGVDLNHQQLASSLRSGKDFVDLGPNPTAPAGWVFEGDYLSLNGIPEDEVGHGTHVAGTISCQRTCDTDVAGVTWRCSLLPVRVLARARRIADGLVCGLGNAADIALGIRWAVNQGAHVLNLSLGGYNETRIERKAVAYAVDRGALVVAAMGNDGIATPLFPAAFPDVVAVGAVTKDARRANFSNYGHHISVCAPGADILSTFPGGGHTPLSGTSMAAPHVAGLAALLLSTGSGVTATTAKEIILNTAEPLRNQQADPVPNPIYGSGLINAERALGET